MKQASFNFMTAVTVCSDFGAQENKVCHCFHCFPIYFHEMMGPGAMVLVFWMLRFKWAFSLSFFTLIRRLFSSPWEWEPRYSAPHLQSLTLCVAGTNNCRHIQIIAASSIHYIHSVLRGWLKLKSKLWGKARVGCFERTASKHVYYLGWNRSPAQVGFMRQVLGPGAPGRPRGIGWRGRWEGGSGWGIHVNPWLIHVNIWQKPVQYCKVITFQLIKIKGKKKSKATQSCPILCDLMGCGLPGSSVHGIFQARILEWVAISFFFKSLLIWFLSLEKSFSSAFSLFNSFTSKTQFRFHYELPVRAD